tara:strand:+ start:1237 stop:2193 length:957 start_codon:yes stop_codon:yes gene_type:complete
VIDKRLTEEEKKKIKPVNQAGGPNYLGKQEMVTVPKKWLSDPDHVVAELAYITPKEQKILLDADIYGSLDGKPNKGPGGIMSLQGDLGGYDASPGGPNDGGSKGDRNKTRASEIMTGKVNVSSPTGMTVGYTGPEGVRDSFGNYVGGKYTGNQGFFGNLLSGANKYGYRDVYTSGPKQGQTKPGYLGRFLGGLGSLITGIPFVGSALGTAYDYGKGIFGVGPKDMSAYNRLGLDGLPPGTLDFDPNAQINVETPNVPVEFIDRFNQNFNYGITGLDEIDMSATDEYGNSYRDSVYSNQMTEKTFNEVFGSGEPAKGFE